MGDSGLRVLTAISRGTGVRLVLVMAALLSVVATCAMTSPPSAAGMGRSRPVVTDMTMAMGDALDEVTGQATALPIALVPALAAGTTAAAIDRQGAALCRDGGPCPALACHGTAPGDVSVSAGRLGIGAAQLVARVLGAAPWWSQAGSGILGRSTTTVSWTPLQLCVWRV